MKTVVIFGGSGFIGQHIIQRIAKIGYRIIIPHQQQANEPENGSKQNLSKESSLKSRESFSRHK